MSLPFSSMMASMISLGRGCSPTLKFCRKSRFICVSCRYALMSGVASPAVPVLYAPGAGKNGYEKSSPSAASIIELWHKATTPKGGNLIAERAAFLQLFLSNWFFGRRGVPLHLSGCPCQYHRRVDCTKFSTSNNF